jgi:DNA/RNA endonuclease YhcR with UshA esterase domain
LVNQSRSSCLSGVCVDFVRFKDIDNTVLVNLGAAYPNQLLTILLKGDAKKLADQITGKTITVQGKVIDYQGKPEIVVTDTKAITIGK